MVLRGIWDADSYQSQDSSVCSLQEAPSPAMGSHLSCMHWSAKGDSAALEVLLCAAGSCPALSVKTVLSTLDLQSFLVNLGKF